MYIAMNNNTAIFSEEEASILVDILLSSTDTIEHLMHDNQHLKPLLDTYPKVNNSFAGMVNYLRMTTEYDLTDGDYTQLDNPENWYHPIGIQQVKVGDIVRPHFLPHRSEYDRTVIQTFTYGKRGFQRIEVQDVEGNGHPFFTTMQYFGLRAH